MDYDRDQPFYFEDETHVYYTSKTGQDIRLYGVGIRMLGGHMCSGYQVDFSLVDPRCMSAARWLEGRGHLSNVHSSRGPHIIIYLERDEYLLFKMTFKGL